MLRKAYSVRFPPALAFALDRLAVHVGSSRSDFVEELLGNPDANDREAIAKTSVPDPPTEKRNLRMSAETLARLTELAGDFEASDFLRRTIAYVVTKAPPQWLQEPTPPSRGHDALQADDHMERNRGQARQQLEHRRRALLRKLDRAYDDFACGRIAEDFWAVGPTSGRTSGAASRTSSDGWRRATAV